MIKFKQLRTTQKGVFGERIIKDLLTRSGCQIFEAPADKAHIIDFVYYNNRNGQFYAADAKTYPRRTKYKDTGIDGADFDKYTGLNIPVVLFFVDEIERAVLYGELEKIKAGARREGKKVYFQLDKLRTARKLSERELSRLKSFNQ